MVPLLEAIPATSECKAYVISVLAKKEVEIVDTSVSIAYMTAKSSGDFRKLNMIGDTSIVLGTLCPARIFDNGGLLVTLSKSAYYSCDNLMMGKWPVYRELADKLTNIVEASHTAMSSKTDVFSGR